MNIAGLMSGSSLDGVDIAIIHFEENGYFPSWKVLHTTTIPFDQNILHHLVNVTQMTGYELAVFDFQLGQYFGQCLQNFIQSIPTTVDYISSHGHTVFHDPANGMTLQIGNGAAIAAATQLPVICQHRYMDIAFGGKGTPLVPIVEKYLYPDYDHFINLGGIANVSIHTKDTVIAYDSCPCNQVFNHYAQLLHHSFDDKGHLSRSGKVDQDLLMALEAIPFYHVSAPKSIDNSWIQSYVIPLMDSFDIAIVDRMATFTEHVSIQLHKAMSQDPCLVTGGGAYHDYLLERCRQKGMQLVIPNDLQINFKESILMAYLGYLRILQLPATLPSVTGASQPTIAGVIYHV